jgi:hypothetical protein
MLRRVNTSMRAKFSIPNTNGVMRSTKSFVNRMLLKWPSIEVARGESCRLFCE